MNDLEDSLRAALSVRVPLLDGERVLAGVGRRVTRHRRRRVALVTMGGLALATVAILLFARSHATPRDDRAAASVVHARRPLFARYHERPPVRSATHLVAALTQLHSQEFAQRTDAMTIAELAFRRGEVHDELRQLRPLRSAARAASADEAVRAYTQAFDAPGAWTRRDEALFACAYLLFEEDRLPEAQRLFGRLLEEHPRSPHAAEAAIALAEPLFEAGELAGALRYYKAASAHAESPLLGYALYKIGWVHVNRGERAPAIAAFQRVVALGAEGRLRSSDDGALVAESNVVLTRLLGTAPASDAAVDSR